jgi:hypothetical protein
MPGDPVPVLHRRSAGDGATRGRAPRKSGDPCIVIAQDEERVAALGNRIERPLFAVEGQRLRIAGRVGTQDPDNS